VSPHRRGDKTRLVTKLVDHGQRLFTIVVSNRAMIGRHLQPAELFVLKIAVAAVLLDAALIAVRGAGFDIMAYGALLGATALMFLAGMAYRLSGRSEEIAATTIAAGLFILFTSAMSLFNYLLVPNGRPTIDLMLAGWDSALGYHWPDMVAWAGRHPIFNEIMRVAYLSTLAQIALCVVVLGLTGRRDELSRLMVAMTIAGAFTVLFWGIFPTTGPSAIDMLTPDVLKAARPVLGPGYGVYVTDLIQNGAPYLSPNDLSGLVAFPSFHTVLALAATWHSRRVKWLFYILLPVNFAVLPAVLAHGAHHLVDIPAGAAVFFGAEWVARIVLRPGGANSGAALAMSARALSR
jgi:hypothetical protein